MAMEISVSITENPELLGKSSRWLEVEGTLNIKIVNYPERKHFGYLETLSF